MTAAYAGIFPQPTGIHGKRRVYGVFPNQQIFGYPCSIETIELPDGDL